MKYSLIILLFCNYTSFSQECTKELLKSKAGTWKAGPQGSINNVTPSDLAKEKTVLATVHKMLTSNYKPMGCQIDYSTVFGKNVNAGGAWVADPYHYAMYVLRYLCDQQSADKTKYYVDVSTPTTVNIAVNSISPLNTLYAATLPEDDFRGYLKLKQRPEWKNGHYYLGEEIVGNSHLPNKIKEYRWLITYNDTLPFVYLTRKEYLLIQKKRLEQKIQESPSEKTYLDKHLSAINDYLKKPASDLMQPAICSWNEEERFEKFVDEGSRGSFFAVRPNMQYYRKNLPKSTPQFFTIVYKVAHGDPIFEENITGIQKAIDFSALKSLLGK